MKTISVVGGLGPMNTTQIRQVCVFLVASSGSFAASASCPSLVGGRGPMKMARIKNANSRLHRLPAPSVVGGLVPQGLGSETVLINKNKRNQ